MLNNQTIPVQTLTTDLGLSVVKRGYTSKESLLELIVSMPYKLKTEVIATLIKEKRCSNHTRLLTMELE